MPGHIELQGYGQLQYTNTLYPWDGRSCLRPPQVDWNDDPVGSYVKEFDLDESLRGQRVCVSFQGVEQAMYLWCNGQFVGYAEDSFTPSEFDLTPYIRDENNRLCVEVYKRSSAAWIEDQDFFRFSGLFRSVYLYAKPKVHINDIWLKADLAADNTTGLLTPLVKLDGETDGASVALVVTDPEGYAVYEGPAAGDTIEIEGIQPWSHAAPVLYHAVLTLRDADGVLQEVVPYDIGFRRFEMINGVMCLNGERVVFNGVNRHEWNADRGRAIGADDMHAAMAVFKKNNINAVRTCHYPDQSLWYDLCDRNGIYMIDETNLESHGSWQKLGAVEPSWNVPGSLPEWKDCVVDRARSMFERDKNHAAVLIWSCGNESYAGEDILAMSQFFHDHDPGRLVHYEGVFHCRAFDAISDMESRMYAKPWEIRGSISNPTRRSPSFSASICTIWATRWAAWRAMCAWPTSSTSTKAASSGTTWTRRSGTPTRLAAACWATAATLRTATPITTSAATALSTPTVPRSPPCRTCATGTTPPPAAPPHDARNAAAAARADRDAAKAQAARKPGTLTVTEGDGNLGVRGDGFEILFSAGEAGPSSLTVNGSEWLWRAPRPAFWRAATDNDRGCGFPQKAAAWLAADVYLQNLGFAVLQKSADGVQVRYTYGVPTVPGAKAELTYTVEPQGTLLVEAVYHGVPGAPELPCFGVKFQTFAPVARTLWTGLSGETYPDRCKGGVFGCHEEVPHIEPALVPQDCGLHVGTRQFTLEQHNACGQTAAALTIEQADAPFAFSALPNTAQEIEAAQHITELPATGRTSVTILGAARGVGGIDSWGTDVEEPYRVSGEGEHRVAFRIVL